MSKRSRSKANIQIHWESLFWILSPVFCLLPYLPILPILPSLPALYICRGSSTNRPVFCKTNPISKWAI